MLSGYRAELVGDFARTLTALISALSQISPDVATQLLQLQTMLSALQMRSSTTGHKIEEVNQLVAGPQLTTNIDEFPTNTRSGMYIYLEASVKSPPFNILVYKTTSYYW